MKSKELKNVIESMGSETMPEKKAREAQVTYQVSETGSREPIAVLPIANLDLPLTVQQLYADKQWSVHCPELDLTTAADTLESALDDLAQLAIEYATEYLADFDLYVNSANRVSHLLFVLAIARLTTEATNQSARQAVRQLFVIGNSWTD
ncbi:MAG: hypothetical protein HY870_00455 [Chloroflexi bacterium]|nr:hypothetical protein [Chloroflexota bacterium]